MVPGPVRQPSAHLVSRANGASRGGWRIPYACGIFCKSNWMRTPDYVTNSRTRWLMDEATHQKVFGWVLRQVARAGLLAAWVSERFREKET